jgi:hypothetical protein
VKKRFERTDLVADATAAEVIVYKTGRMYGASPDRTEFEGNRDVDRFVGQDGNITCMDDSAEILLTRAGLAEDLRQVARSRSGRKAAA